MALENVTVVATSQRLGDTFMSTTATDASGAYAIAIPDDVNALLRFQRKGYYVEERQLGDVRSTPRHSGLVNTLQRVVTVAVPGALGSTLFNDDLGRDTDPYYWNDYCGPCRIFSVTVDRPARVRVLVRWSGTTPLSVWAGDRLQDPMPRGDAAPETSGSDVTVTMMPSADNLILVGPDWPSRPHPNIPDTPFTVTTESVP